MKHSNFNIVFGFFGGCIFYSLLILSSCKKEEPKNCACNKITSKFVTYNGTTYNGEVYTQNECSGYLDTIQIQGYSQEPNVGDCY